MKKFKKISVLCFAAVAFACAGIACGDKESAPKDQTTGYGVFGADTTGDTTGVGNLHGETGAISGLEGFAATDYTFKGYAIKYDATAAMTGNSGENQIQVKTSATKAMYDKIKGKGASSGTLLVEASKVEGSELTVDTTGAVNLETRNAWVANADKTAYESVVFLKEIPAKYYGTDFVARSYVKVDDAYYYTATTEATSLAEIVYEEYNDETSPLASVKDGMRDAFNKYTVTVDGTSSTMYYGDKITAPEAQMGKVFLNYVYADDETKVWNVEDIVTGSVSLVSTYTNAIQFYSEAAGTATLAVDGLAEGITTATVNGVDVAVTTTLGKVTVSGLTDLEYGKSYSIEVGGKVTGFTYVKTINDVVPYAYNDDLHLEFPGATITSITDVMGNSIAYENGVLTGVEENTVRDEVRYDECLVYATTAGGDVEVHKITLNVFGHVIYDNYDFVEFFLGTPVVGDNGKITDFDPAGVIYGYTPTEGYSLTVGIANDIDLTKEEIVFARKATSVTSKFVSIFDGLGHTIKYNGSAGGSAITSLFGYQMYGIFRNFALEVTYSSMTAGAAVLGQYTAQVILEDETVLNETVIENVVIKVKNNSTSAARYTPVIHDFVAKGSGVWNNFVYIYDAATLHADTYKSTLLRHWKSTQTHTFTNCYTVVADGATNYQVNSNSDNGKIYVGENMEVGVKVTGLKTYTLSEAKTNNVVKVGDWQITYGEKVGDTTIAYAG